MRIGYARVSTKSQDTAAQLSALKKAGCERIFQEKASGGRWERPELHRLLDLLRTDDVVVVWKLDRLSRSLKDLLLVLEKIDQLGAHFRSLTEDIDTTSSSGRMMMQLVGTFAEFERSLLRERTREGLEEARKAGRIGGRRPKLTSEQQKEAIALVDSGKKSSAAVARLFRVHPATISRLVTQHRATQLERKSLPSPSAKPTKAAPRSKKRRSKGPSPKTVAKPAGMVLDTIGLARPKDFKDSPGAVSVLSEVKNLPMMDRMEWRETSPRQRPLVAIWEAEELIEKFRNTHADATIKRRYKVKDKTIIELKAVYKDERADHRMVFAARNR